MRKIILFILIGLSNLVVAQEVQKEVKSKKFISDRKHEVKLGALKLLSGSILEGTYEYIYSKDFTYGISGLINLDNGTDYPEDFSITPFARFYFQETKEYGAKGFFVEGFAKYLKGTVSEDLYIYDNQGNYIGQTNKQNYNSGSVGLSLGKKWINNSGFVFEILFGVGRNIAKSEFAPDASFRGDFNIGYRF